ncbi:hypothetical protein GCM10010271_17300 [Streptomyces kurssanovii]|nr:hypothetical protein GCM10010271_17300 [Streptomyces kurssanovii]
MALALLLGVTAAACGEGGKEEESSYVATSEVCDSVFQGASARAVDSVMDSKSFSRINSGISDRVAASLKKGYASGRSWTYPEEFCELNPEGTGGIGHNADIDFSIYAPSDIDGGQTAAGEQIYAMGKEAKASPRGARLYFECVSPQLKGSTVSPARIFGSLRLERDLWEDSVQHREANLTIIHTVSLAMAKELECENNGNLPSSPIFKEIQSTDKS